MLYFLDQPNSHDNPLTIPESPYHLLSCQRKLESSLNMASQKIVSNTVIPMTCYLFRKRPALHIPPTPPPRAVIIPCVPPRACTAQSFLRSSQHTSSRLYPRKRPTLTISPSAQRAGPATNSFAVFLARPSPARPTSRRCTHAKASASHGHVSQHIKVGQPHALTWISQKRPWPA